MHILDYNMRQYVHFFRILIRELRGSKLEPEVPFMDRFLSPHANCLHIGASDGRHSLYMARRAPNGRVHCIEPSPYTLAVLNWISRVLGVRNLVFHNIAIGSTDGEMTLITPIKRNGHRGRGIAYVSSRPSAAENIEPNAGYIGFEYQSVRTQSLDTFCTAQDIRKIDFLRCDIEGGEILMLEGGKATISYHQPVIMIEVHPRFLIERYERSANELWEKLTNLHYVMFYLSENNLVKATHFSDESAGDYFCIPKTRLEEFALTQHRCNEITQSHS